MAVNFREKFMRFFAGKIIAVLYRKSTEKGSPRA
jgi:hypothetical protein